MELFVWSESRRSHSLLPLKAVHTHAAEDPAEDRVRAHTLQVTRDSH